MIFWASAAAVAAKFENFRTAEAKLFALASRFGNREATTYEMELFDTQIPRHVVPLKMNKKDKEGHFVLHGVKVTNNTEETEPSSDDEQQQAKAQAPLVLLHGYANGSLYFYRNLVGLSSFFQTIYSLDMLGWGLSSRPDFKLENDSPECAEAFFVESLEAWRQAQDIDKMILAGHSMGGYLSVAYCEKYPERVERLVLLSPVGIPEQDNERTVKAQEMIRNSSFSRRTMFSFYGVLFGRGHTPGSMSRMFPQTRVKNMVTSYVENRLPAITDPEEQQAVADYLYCNSALPGSGEFALKFLLNPFAMARNPLIRRIPLLKVPQVTFLYGSNDWMDSSGGLDTKKFCEQITDSQSTTPKIDVYEVSNAGHLLMLDNYEEFNAGVVIGGLGLGALPRNAPVPTKLLLLQESEKLNKADDVVRPATRQSVPIVVA
jgi:cardiolipin-specific phospholipase